MEVRSSWAVVSLGPRFVASDRRFPNKRGSRSQVTRASPPSDGTARHVHVHVHVCVRFRLLSQMFKVGKNTRFRAAKRCSAAEANGAGSPRPRTEGRKPRQRVRLPPPEAPGGRAVRDDGRDEPRRRRRAAAARARVTRGARARPRLTSRRATRANPRDRRGTTPALDRPRGRARSRP